MRAFLLAAFAYCILGLAHAEPIDPVALAKNESSDLSALSQKQLYAVADEDAVQFKRFVNFTDTANVAGTYTRN
jgi:hypothetical protein